MSEATQLNEIKKPQRLDYTLYGTINWMASLIARKDGYRCGVL